MKQGISAIILAFNSQPFIEDCIKSLIFCDEIIVVDSGSTDRTVAIAKNLGASIVKVEQGDFAHQRNVGLAHAQYDWIFYIDTDERATKRLADSIEKEIKNPRYAAYRVVRKNFYLGNHTWPKTELLERLFQKRNLKGWQGKLHETARVEGAIGQLDGYLLHYTHRTLEEMLEKTINWSQIEAQLRLDAKHPPVVWWRFFRVMLTGFTNSYITQGGWKAGTAGLVESIYQAYSMFITYARLWEVQQHL